MKRLLTLAIILLSVSVFAGDFGRLNTSPSDGSNVKVQSAYKFTAGNPTYSATHGAGVVNSLTQYLDHGDMFSGYSVTIPESGLYFFQVIIGWGNNYSGAIRQTSMEVDGGSVAVSSIPTVQNGYYYGNQCCYFGWLNKNQVVRVSYYHDAGSTLTVGVYFCGFKVN